MPSRHAQQLDFTRVEHVKGGVLEALDGLCASVEYPATVG